jgi:hypothetical protein
MSLIFSTNSSVSFILSILSSIGTLLHAYNLPDVGQNNKRIILLRGMIMVEKTKKDMMGQKLYKSMKKHPIIKNPIVLLYLVSLLLLAISYIIYLIASESI